jgi:hypothetical protein
VGAPYRLQSGPTLSNCLVVEDDRRPTLDALREPPVREKFDDAAAANEARKRLVDWQRRLRANTAEGRRVIASLVDGRFTFTPRQEGRRRSTNSARQAESTRFSKESWRFPVTRGFVPTGIRGYVDDRVAQEIGPGWAARRKLTDDALREECSRRHRWRNSRFSCVSRGFVHAAALRAHASGPAVESRRSRSQRRSDHQRLDPARGSVGVHRGCRVGPA